MIHVSNIKISDVLYDEIKVDDSGQGWVEVGQFEYPLKDDGSVDLSKPRKIHVCVEGIYYSLKPDGHLDWDNPKESLD